MKKALSGVSRSSLSSVFDSLVLPEVEAALGRAEPPDEQAAVAMVMLAIRARQVWRLIAATMRKRLSGTCESAVRSSFFISS